MVTYSITMKYMSYRKAFRELSNELWSRASLTNIVQNRQSKYEISRYINYIKLLMIFKGKSTTNKTSE